LTTRSEASLAPEWIGGRHVSGRSKSRTQLAIFLSMGVFMSVVAELYRRVRQRAALYQQGLSLRESETRFSTVFHANPIGMSITRLADGQYLDVNRSYLSLFGHTREEVLRHTSLQLQTWATPEDRERLIRTLREQGSARNKESRYRRKSGAAGARRWG
jgi:PAS domain S-box-containing protein